MHMADALLSPAVGMTMWAAAGTAVSIASRRLKQQGDEQLVPLMGVLGAFVFAAQMVNFGIPGTGSSGHLGGGLLLALLLGRHAALLVIASVLTIQAIFFADGGLLALGANVFNLGVAPCLVAYPLVYRPLAGAAPSDTWRSIAILVAAVVALQLGALGVVLQTALSGMSSLPLDTFLWLMLPIHLAIGLVEGAATAALVLFLRRAWPGLLDGEAPVRRPAVARARPLLAALAVAAVVTGGVLSWFASVRPDGLEWSVTQAAGTDALAAPGDGLHGQLARLQQRYAWLPDYDGPATDAAVAGAAAASADPAPWPHPKAGTSVAGVLGGVVTLALVTGVGWLLRRRRARA
jgi:cobalt/nickel transport system permease protein